MAIGFARLEFVQRSEGQNVCCKSAYNSRDVIKFEGTKFQEANLYNFKKHGKAISHHILLPDHADERFYNAQYLWNHAEKFENRKNSQVAMEMILALPDDKIVSVEDKIFLAVEFAKEHFVSKGLGVQINVHKPDGADEKNWHAHILITTRQFDETGKTFTSHKPRDLFPEIRNGRVTDGNKWGKTWADFQNQFFKDRGYDLRVDPNGVIAQKHMGPVRLRGQIGHIVFNENEMRKELNVLESYNVSNILKKLTEHQSVFTGKCVEYYIQKHIPAEHHDEIRIQFWKQPEIVRLYSRFKHEDTMLFSTIEVINEERKSLRLATRIHARNSYYPPEDLSKFKGSLNEEQINAFDNTLSKGNLVCINGVAGTGKSTLLVELKKAYESQGYRVRGLGPDYATANVLREKGFEFTENIHRFLFKNKAGKRDISKGGEVWIIDETSKVGNKSLLELLKIAEKRQVKLVLTGDYSQYSPVERGEMFLELCKRFSFEYLGSIQRQQDKEQKQIVKSFAEGKTDNAIDMIASSGGFKWNKNKTETLKDLVLDWAVDQVKEKKGKTLIMAMKKEEINVINDVIRLYRKKRGELGEKEFLCKTAYGSTVVSVGDVLEFRRNGDTFTNGTRGVLVKASENEFVVQINEKNKFRNVSFNPKEYSHFQLGYASTLNKTQGSTADRTYIMHCPQMRADSFYIGFSRHVKSSRCYVSHSEIKNISELKRLAKRPKEYGSTIGLLTKDDVDWKEKTMAHIKSDSSIQRLWGYGLKKLSNFDYARKYIDRFTNNQFYRPDIESDKGTVIKEISGNSDLYPERYVTNRFFVKQDGDKNLYKLVEKKERIDTVQAIRSMPELLDSPVSEVKENFSVERELDNGDLVNTEEIAKAVYAKVAKIEKSLGNKKKDKTNLDKENIQDGKYESKLASLDPKKQDLVKSYFSSIKESSQLKDIVRIEAESRQVDVKFTSCFGDWMDACKKRNEKAFTAEKELTEKELREVLKSSGFKYLKQQALKHKEFIENRTSNQDIDKRLTVNIEALCFRLFPQGPTNKTGKYLRFGNKGSLSVCCRGDYAGSFRDFENDERGGPTKLIQKVLCMDFKQAREWATDFLGESKNIEVPSSFKNNRWKEKEESWVSVGTDPKIPAPALDKISKTLDAKFIEVARHEYKDRNGKTLFFTLRLINKETGKKFVPPLSYGYFKGGSKNPQWKLKGYQNGGLRTPYNLDMLAKRPSSTVLIVEGEKTADAANQLFVDKNMVCISWCGGASSIGKTDWSALYGRDVVIWPDNDKAGFEASDAICSELRKVGVKSLEVVDKEILEKELPKKWDLADQLPKDKPSSLIKDLLLGAKQKTAGINRFYVSVEREQKDGITKEIEKLKANEVFWRVEERLRPSLEKELVSKPWEINNKIIAEASKVVLNKENIMNALNKMGVNDVFADRVCYQTMIEWCSKGEMPSRERINEIKEILSEIKINNSDFKNSKSKEVSTFAFDKAVSKLIENRSINRENQNKVSSEIQKEMKIVVQQVESRVARNQEVFKEHGKSTHKSFQNHLENYR